MNDSIFRAYDIRGIFPDDFNEKDSYIIGQAYGSYVTKLNIKEVIVGFDNRLSSPTISKNLIAGITSAGVNVVNLGIVTTPMFYYAKIFLDNNAGIMVTASHNPKEYNGFKLSIDEKGNMLGDEISEFKEFLKSGVFTTGEGTTREYNIYKEYVKNMINALRFGNKNIKVAVDCGNGCGSLIIEDILKLLPVDYELLYCESDGTFPNHHPDPSVNENLKDLCDLVVKAKFDLGIAVDADADRVRLVDNLGRMIDVDIQMAIMYKQLNTHLKVRKGLFDVKCSKALSDTLDKLNIEKIMWRTGNSYIARKMMEDNIDFGGEFSGHLYFYDYYQGFDDGIYAGLRMAEILSNGSKTMAELNDEIPKYVSSPELFYQTTDIKKLQIIEKIKEYVINQKYHYLDIDGVKAMFDDGWALVRSSNTGPKLTIRFEAHNSQRLEEIQKEFMNQIALIDKELDN